MADDRSDESVHQSEGPGQEKEEVDSMISRLREFQESLDLELERSLLLDEETSAQGSSPDRQTTHDEEEDVVGSTDELNASLSSLMESYTPQGRTPFDTPNVLQKILSTISSTGKMPETKLFLDDFSVTLSPTAESEQLSSKRSGVEPSFFDSPLETAGIAEFEGGEKRDADSFNRLLKGQDESFTSVRCMFILLYEFKRLYEFNKVCL